ncbi:hypothetical protein QJS04_geneDACA024053 [Acorus gramineus]|uniref:Uncharacterized protein n=1 Tax=Acorus gramineus TaxID=55184 RepID=A0AAV9A3A4_ACOGR|nr:hypothetical protein QJS04_geneDACA024053 [Acorus gramineus]
MIPTSAGQVGAPPEDDPDLRLPSKSTGRRSSRSSTRSFQDRRQRPMRRPSTRSPTPSGSSCCQ